VTLPQRAAVTPELLDMLRDEYAIDWDGDPVDLGGSNNLNLQLPADADRADGYVARIYCPWTSPARLRGIQLARFTLVGEGLPFAETMATRDGETIVEHEGRVVEVEQFVAGDAMDLDDGLEIGVPVLARIHEVLADLDPPPGASIAPWPNHVEAEAAYAWAHQGTAALRTASPSGTDLLVAGLAEDLAAELADAELPLHLEIWHQLVHGDFWDNNVLFRDGEIVTVLDLDFMGERPRIDDLALTLYYTSSTLGVDYPTAERIARLALLVDLYDDALTEKLSDDERAALPYAIARTVLSFVGKLALVDDREQRARIVEELRPDLEWSVDIVRDPNRWQDAFAG
jgi:homoserine kinase type II